MNVQFSTTSGAKADREACEQEANRRLLYYNTEMLIDLATDYIINKIGTPAVDNNYVDRYTMLRSLVQFL